MRVTLENKLPSSVEEGMPGANRHGWGGWCAVLVGDGSNHRESGHAAPGWGFAPVFNPPKVPPVWFGDMGYTVRRHG